MLFVMGCAAPPAPDQASAAAGGACRDATVSDGIRLTVERRADNSLIADANVALREAAPVYLEFGSAQLGWLRTPTTVADTQHRLPLLRLRADTSYQARAFALDAAGCASAVAMADFTTGSLPTQLKRFTSNTSGQAGFPLTLMDLRGPEANTRVLAAYDSAGFAVWYYIIPTEMPDGPSGGNQLVVVQRPNRNLLLMNAYDSIYEITPDGHLVRRSRFEIPPASRIHHDLIELPDGRFLFIGAEDRTPPDNCEGKPNLPIRGDTLHVVDVATGAEHKVWSAFDSLNVMTDCAEKLSDQTIQGVAEWLHTNSINVGPRGNIIVSLRRLDQVISLSPDFQTIEWRLGGPGSSFTFASPSDTFYGQHSAYELPGGRVLLFDNGRRRPSTQGGEFSRGLELELDYATMSARKVWELRLQPDVYADRVSNVVRLSDGNTFLNFGFRTDDPAAEGTLAEARPDETLHWQQSLKAAGRRTSRYRAIPVTSLAGEQPAEPTVIVGRS